jgi:hypothetical protein
MPVKAKPVDEHDFFPVSEYGCDPEAWKSQFESVTKKYLDIVSQTSSAKKGEQYLQKAEAELGEHGTEIVEAVKQNAAVIFEDCLRNKTGLSPSELVAQLLHQAIAEPDVEIKESQKNGLEVTLKSRASTKLSAAKLISSLTSIKGVKQEDKGLKDMSIADLYRLQEALTRVKPCSEQEKVKDAGPIEASGQSAGS